jgi:dihydrofolate reductase
MKTLMHMAVSMDGFIARSDGDTKWVSKIDFDLFGKRCKKIGCIVVGRKTFEELNPIKDVLILVLTSDKVTKAKEGNVIFVNSAKQAIEVAAEKGFKNILIAGGGHANGAFLNDNLVDEVFLSIHPIVLSKGIKLFEGANMEHIFTLIDSRELGEGLVELHYQND